MGVIMNVFAGACAGVLVSALADVVANVLTLASRPTDLINDEFLHTKQSEPTLGGVLSESNNTDLILNAANGNTERVKLLLKNGANVRTSNDEALQLSAKNGHTAIVVALLNGGANIHACSDYAL